MKVSTIVQTPIQDKNYLTLHKIPIINKAHRFRMLPSVKSDTFSTIYKEKGLDKVRSKRKVFFTLDAL